MIRCCLCREHSVGLESTDLPGSGWRCRNHDGCAQRVRDIVAAHRGLAETLEMSP